MVSDCYHPVINGVVTSVSCLVKALEVQGLEVELFVPDDHRPYQDEGVIHRFASAPFWLHKEERFTYPWPPAAVRPLWTGRFDLVHIHTPFNLGGLAGAVAAVRGLPRVFTHHTLWEEYSHYLPLPQRWVKPLAVWICRTMCQVSQRVVAPSREVRERLRAQQVTRPIDVIPTGIDPDVFRGGDPSLAESWLGLESGQALFLHIGRVAREKSIEVVLRCFAEASRQRPGLKLAVVGDGPARAEMEALAGSLEADITFLGFRPRNELKHLMARARGLLFASQTETQGLVLLEAQAAGVPVVAVAASGTSEGVDPGRSGLLLEPGDERSFVGAILRLLDDAKFFQELSRNARLFAQEFSSSSMAEKMVRCYSLAIAQKGQKHP